MQKLRQYKKTRNKNRNHQSNFDSPQGEGEFMNESNDSMLTVSDSLGNMDHDGTREDDIERTLLDEFAGDSELSADHDFPAGSDQRSAAASSTDSPQETASNTTSATDSGAKKKSKFELQPKRIPSALKEKANETTARAQEMLYPYAKDLNAKLMEFYREARVHGSALNTQIKKQPYYFALGAVVAGFTLAKLFVSDTSKTKS